MLNDYEKEIDVVEWIKCSLNIHICNQGEFMHQIRFRMLNAHCANLCHIWHGDQGFFFQVFLVANVVTDLMYEIT